MKQIIASVVLVAVLLMMGTPREAMAQAPGKKITVGLMPKAKGNPYFSSVNEGAQAAAKELGNVEVVFDGPTDGDPVKAAAILEQWILKRYDVIAVAPNDAQVLLPAMKKARERGIKVITFDADGAPGSREFFVNQATAEGIGFALIDNMAGDLGGANAKGEIAIITGALTAANQNEWIKHMRVRIAKYPGMTIVGVKPSDDKAPMAFSATQDLMKAYPNLKGVIAITSVGFPAAADAIKQAGNSGKVLVTGLSTPNIMKPHVKDGTVKSVFLWDTKALGGLTIQTARALVDGTLKPGATSIKAGSLGDKKIDGEAVLLGDPLIFNKDNIDKFDF